jgi:SAM-dependent methyltransferase
MDVAKDYGAEVVGIDLSRAVDRAHENLKNCRFVHVAQCNIMEAPFREEVFDFVYSIGVFMFIPNPRRAFESMVEYLKRGGYYAVWVYSDYMHPLKKLISNLIRSVTKRLPHRLLHFLCYVAVPFGYLQRILHKNRITRYLAAPLFLVPFSAHKKWRVRIADTFDWYSPEYHSYHTEREVVDWFEQNGFDEIRVLSLPVNIIGRRKWDSYLTQNR